MWIALYLFFSMSGQSKGLPIYFDSSVIDERRVSIQLCLKPDQLKDSGAITFIPVDYVLYEPIVESKKVKDGYVRIDKVTDKPGYLNFSSLLSVSKLGYYLTEPGDNVIISLDQNGFQFSGVGAEKYRLQYLLDSLKKNSEKPNGKIGIASFYIDSVGEYIQWENYFKQQLDAGRKLIQSFRGLISDFVFDEINDSYIRETIDELSLKFEALKLMVQQKRMDVSIIIDKYDNSFSKTVENWLTFAIDKESIEPNLLRERLYRTFSFDGSAIEEREISLILYRSLFRHYKGKDRERFVVNTFPRMMNDVGLNDETEKMLEEYYADSSFPKWKKFIKGEELKVRTASLKSFTPEFNLVDKGGKLFTQRNINGKFAVLFFWKSDVPESRQKMAEFMNIEKSFYKNKKVKFVYISMDSSKLTWLKSIDQFKNESLHVYSGGLGVGNEIVLNYAVTRYPTALLVHPSGGIMNLKPAIDYTRDSGSTLKELLLYHTIALPNDGPYVWHNGSTSVIYQIEDTSLTKKEYLLDKVPQLKVQTDVNSTFMVRQKFSLIKQPSDYLRQQKLLVLSDIEGNFTAFRKLLQANEVIDDKYNWIFDKGHLVFAGDMFDRGYQVTECLWLIYSLEEKAKAAGGYVHFILGNHEIMNMQGFHRYVQDKYVKSAKLMGKTLTELYNEDSELGRWLRTKNVIEKIGDLLFVHGGISPEVNRLNLSMEQMNKLAQVYYGRVIDSSDMSIMTIYDSRKGETYRISPFWSRGYYQGKRISERQLDSTLQKFNVRHIITGHTIVADTISVHYGGKVINTDTKHAEGKSEALLIEGDHFYRVNDRGERVLLFVDRRK